MRTKNFLLTLCVIVFVSLTFIIFGHHKPESIQNIVSSTNEQIRNFKENLHDAETKTLNADEKYLHQLGFTDQPRIYPKDVWKNTSLPVFVTYVLDGQESQAVGFIFNIAKKIPNNTILVYNLGVSEQGYRMLTNYCNSTRCQVITLDLSEYPSHINIDVLHAYRPLVIQDALYNTGAIFFMESNYRILKNASYDVISKLYKDVAENKGILAWPYELKNPVSSLTHKKMFEYFHTNADSFLFLQMVRAEMLIIVNTENIHHNIMLPWVQCALTQDCIIPIGAQSAGCRFDKKPQFRYSGCHSYDTSALNIALGLYFEQNSDAYTNSDSINYFEAVPLNKAEAILKELEQNSTSEGCVTGCVFVSD